MPVISIVEHEFGNAARARGVSTSPCKTIETGAPYRSGNILVQFKQYLISKKITSHD